MDTRKCALLLALAGLAGTGCVREPDANNPSVGQSPSGASAAPYTPPSYPPAPAPYPGVTPAPAPGPTPVPMSMSGATPVPGTPGTTPVPAPGTPPAPMGAVVPVPTTPGTPPPAAPPATPAPGAPPVAGPDEWATERVKGGTRLKAIFADTAEGGRFFQFEWFDTGLGTRCRFTTAADGQQRCLPLPPRTAVDGALIRYYRDDKCGEPLLPASDRSAGCAAGFGTRTVNHLVSIHRLGAPGRVEKAFSLQPNAEGKLVCQATEVIGPKEFFTVAAEVPPSAFVATTSYGAEAQAGRRIWPVVRTAADGMRVRTSWWDSKLGQECTLRRGLDGKYRCLPYLVFQSPLSAFADAACSQPAAVSRVSPEGTFVRVLEKSSCPARETLYRTEVLRYATTVYRRTSQGCEGVTVPAGARVFAVREMVPWEEFVPWTESRAGIGRLQQRVLSSVEGSVDRPTIPVDASFGEACEFTRGETGKVLCLPLQEEIADGVERFGDSSCNQRLARVAEGVECRAAQQVSVAEGAWCAPFLRTKTLGSWSGSTFRRDGDGRCEASKDEGRYRTLGADVPLGNFVEGTELMQ